MSVNQPVFTALLYISMISFASSKSQRPEYNYQIMIGYMFLQTSSHLLLYHGKYLFTIILTVSPKSCAVNPLLLFVDTVITAFASENKISDTAW